MDSRLDGSFQDFLRLLLVEYRSGLFLNILCGIPRYVPMLATSRSFLNVCSETGATMSVSSFLSRIPP